MKIVQIRIQSTTCK